MPVLAFMFKLALELYYLSIFISKHCNWWEECLQMEVY